MIEQPNPPGQTPELSMALMFHEAYERLAPSFDYETRPESRVFDPESRNGRLMIAVCADIMAQMERQVIAAMEGMAAVQKAQGVPESPKPQNEDFVTFLLEQANKIASGEIGEVHAGGVVLCNLSVSPAVIGFVGRRISPAQGTTVFTALLEQAKQQSSRTPSGIILPH